MGLGLRMIDWENEDWEEEGGEETGARSRMSWTSHRRDDPHGKNGSASGDIY